MALSCREFRDQQQLLALKKRLSENKLDPKEREEIERLVQDLEIKLWRPVILTVNGRADSVLLDVRVYERYLQAGNLAKLLAPAEREVESGRTSPARDFLKEFKRGRNMGRG